MMSVLSFIDVMLIFPKPQSRHLIPTTGDICFCRFNFGFLP